MSIAFQLPVYRLTKIFHDKEGEGWQKDLRKENHLKCHSVTFSVGMYPNLTIIFVCYQLQLFKIYVYEFIWSVSNKIINFFCIHKQKIKMEIATVEELHKVVDR